MENQKHFHLVRYFTYVTAPLIIASIIIAAVTHRVTMLDDLQKMGELANVTLGQTLSNTYANQLKSIQAFSQSDNNNQADWMINDLLNRPINDFLKNTPVVRVKFFTASGETFFSTNNSQTRKVEKLEQHAFKTAISGNIYSEMKMQPQFIKNDGSLHNLMIVNTYVPIIDGEDTLGVLELYNDVSVPYEQVQNGLHVFITVLFVLGLFFFYTVIYFVQKAEKIINAKQETEKRDHEYLKIAFKKASESTKAKSEFLASMSHELRTPLNAIIGYSEILLEENTDSNNSTTTNDLQSIKSAGIHLKTLIEEILDHAKIESGVVDIQTSNCRLQEIIHSCVSYVSPDAMKNKNEIIVSVDDSIQDINTDKTKIKRIILNLISNANKFTKNGEITITGKVRNNIIVVQVKDTGVGIPKKQFHNIFEPFTQVDNSYTRQHGGTGLGLAISQEYAKALGGGITVNSKEGEGTVMELSFPYCVAKYKNVSDVKVNNSPAA